MTDGDTRNHSCDSNYSWEMRWETISYWSVLQNFCCYTWKCLVASLVALNCCGWNTCWCTCQYRNTYLGEIPQFCIRIKVETAVGSVFSSPKQSEQTFLLYPVVSLLPRVTVLLCSTCVVPAIPPGRWPQSGWQHQSGSKNPRAIWVYEILKFDPCLFAVGLSASVWWLGYLSMQLWKLCLLHVKLYWISWPA